MEEVGAMLTVQDIEKEEPVTLKSPKNPTPTETVFLSNIDQTLAFPVGTVFFFDVIPSMKHSTVGIAERVKKAMSDVFLIPYYFMAGRLNYNAEDNRLELVCNNAGVSFVSAMSTLRLKDLGDLRLPNPSFQHLIVRVGRQPEELVEAPIFTIQAIFTTSFHFKNSKTKIVESMFLIGLMFFRSQGSSVEASQSALSQTIACLMAEQQQRCSGTSARYAEATTLKTFKT
ncbi:hypothetical protein Sjap_007533 [Stephania japonica]|uniref:Uncharacterized protein n=1 Tax=Stephania japonica TaxID=461633 RepID=A0AAP0JND8_9MAGN